MGKLDYKLLFEAARATELTSRAAGQKYGIPTSTISRMRAVMRQSAEMAAAVERRDITVLTAIKLLNLPDAERHAALKKVAADKSTDPRKLAKALGRLPVPGAYKSPTRSLYVRMQRTLDQLEVLSSTVAVFVVEPGGDTHMRSEWLERLIEIREPLNKAIKTLSKKGEDDGQIRTNEARFPASRRHGSASRDTEEVQQDVGEQDCGEF